MNVLEDAKLIEEYKNGDKNAFKKLLCKYKLPLFNYILKMVKDKNIAEDIFQNVWVSLIKALPRYREQNKFPYFIFKLAHSKTMDYLRQNKYQYSVIEDCLPATETLHTEYEKQEVISILNSEVLKLPIKQREVFLLRQHTELSFKEIAQILNCPINTVLSRMRYAVISLRKEIENAV